MQPLQTAFLAAGAIVSANVYFVLVFVVALAASNHLAVYDDLAAVGVTYLSFAAQIMFPTRMLLGGLLVVGSIALGAAAGILLLV